MNENLQKAYQAIQAGQRDEALTILTPIIRAEPGNADAWYLLGFALSDPEKRIYAFEQVLRLDPNNQPAQRQLAKLRHRPVAESAPRGVDSLTGAQPQPQSRSLPVAWILTGAALLLLMFLTIGGLLLFRSISAASQPTATAVNTTVKGTATSRPSVTPYPRRATATATPTLPPTLTMTPSPTATSIVLVKVFDDQELPSVGMQTPVAFTEIQSGHLDAGASVSLNLDVDETSEIVFSIKWTGAQPLEMMLVDPNGKTINQSYASLKAGKTTYRIAKPAVGAWVINLTAADAGDYGVLGKFASGTLPISSIIWGNPNTLGMVDITASFPFKPNQQQPEITNASGVALVELPNGVVDMVVLNYKGYYRGDYQIPADVSGPVSIHITVKGMRNGVNFSRSVLIAFPLLGSAIKLTGEYADRIGMKNGRKTLEIDVGVDSTYEGKCSVVGTLKLGEQLAGGGNAEVALVVGHNVVTLSFDMYILSALMKADGPYTLATLYFQNSRLTPVMPFAKNVWQTAPYHWQDFNNP